MNTIKCPYCGNPLKAQARGCHRCALNIEAEHKIDQLVLRIIPISLIALIALVIVLFVFVKRP